MQLKFFLYKLFCIIFLLFCYNDFVSGSLINRQYYSHFRFNKKDFLFLKKNEYFSFLISKKLFFLKDKKVVIGNNNFIGFLEKNRFTMFYIVKSKDTLYSISKKYAYNYRELSKFNLINKPYKIVVGQKIWMGDFLINQNNCSIINAKKNITDKYISCEFIFKTPSTIINFLKDHTKETKICFFCTKALKKDNNVLNIKSFYFIDHWSWPVQNKNIQYFYNDNIDNKKIEISGFKGQPVFAAAPGEVVFITDLFEKYGRLIIIRHNKNYLSIYAFNDLILVKEKEKVYENQQISTMGLSVDTHQARLYFEIRYLGKSINPLSVLPKINKKI